MPQIVEVQVRDPPESALKNQISTACLLDKVLTLTERSFLDHCVGALRPFGPPGVLSF